MKKLEQQIDWIKCEGLIPVIVQNQTTLQVLMLGFMNSEALSKTISTKRVTFYSRSKKRLWQKGETSGNYLQLIDIQLDCDHDTLLVTVSPHGPTCHRGNTSCFSTESAPQLGFLGYLEDVIRTRKDHRPQGSYTTSLFTSGLDRIAQKLGEEAIETIIASKNQDKASLLNEISDLIYHLLVLLREKDTNLSEVLEVLRRRHQQ